METNANQRVTCIVNYPYEASEPDELSLRAGDVVRRVERLSGGWWRGELRGRTGMFPDNFCTVTTEHKAPAGGRCRAVFSYQPANPDELPLCVGDVLDVLGEVEEGWWQGRRAGRVGVFPSNFVVMVDPAPAPAQPSVPVTEPAPALPPKPVKEQCLVLFPYTAVNDDELTLKEGDVVTIICKEAPDRGWWRGELNGRQGLFPDNFVRPLPPVAAEVEEKKPERPSKGAGAANTALYPLLNKYSEKTASVKELTTSKISMHKENSIGKESSTQITHTNKSESERIIHSEAGDGALDSQVKKPPVPAKKSPTPSGGGGVGGLLSGLKSKMMPSQDKDKDKDKEKEKDKDKERDRDRERSASTVSSSSSGEWDKPDGAAGSRLANNANTFDHVERNSILNDPRAGRVKAPRRRPPSQALRDDTPPPALPATSPPAAATPASPASPAALSNGHDAPADRTSTEKADEIKPRAREWEKHRAPWMDELKLNQAKKTSFGGDGRANKGSTDRMVECGVEERRATHSMEMSRSTSSISSRISLIDSLEEKSSRQSLERKDNGPPASAPAPAPAPVPASDPPRLNAHSPTAAGRTFTTLLDDLKKPSPPPPTAQLRHDPPHSPQKAERTHTNYVTEKTERVNEVVKTTAGGVDKTSSVERVERTSEDRPASGLGGMGGASGAAERNSTLERRRLGGQDPDGGSGLLAHLTLRISNLEKLVEVQNAKFTAAVEELSSRLAAETERRLGLQAQLDRLARAVDK